MYNMTLEYAYLFLAILVTIILTYFGFTAINGSKSDGDSTMRRKKTILILSLIGWHLYIYIMSTLDVFKDLSFPPKFVLLLILPAFVFTGFFLFRHRNEAWIQRIPPSSLIFYQSFRILIEGLFVLSVGQGILHPNVTIEGYNYDMVFAFTSLIMGGLYVGHPHKWRSAVKAWNMVGLLVIMFIIFLFMTTLLSRFIWA